MESKHPWLKDIDLNEKSQEKLLVFNDKNIERSQEQVDKMLVEMKKEQMIRKYKEKEDINFIKNFSLYLITKDGRLDLVSNCDTKEEVDYELKIRSCETKILATKVDFWKMKAEVTNSHKGTYVILETYRIR